jgi:predicted alpha/beta superfamily hydrolase
VTGAAGSLRAVVTLGALLGGACGGLAAQQASDGEPFVLGRTYKLQSAALGEDRPVTVALPLDYDPARAYPVVYVLDGPGSVVHTAAAVKMLSQSHRMPESIVVAVSNTNERNANMTPPEQGARVRDGSVGRADEFKAFFRDELKPWVEARYPTDALDVLIGASAGGVFIAHVLNTEPDLFDGYISIGAALEHDDGRFVASLDNIFERFPDLRGSLYLAMANEGGVMLAANLHLVRTLEAHAPSSFRWKFREMPDETHDSAPARATYDGLEWIFEAWNPQDLWAELYDRGVDVLPRIEAHFARLSQEVGFEVEVPVTRVRMVARRLELAGHADRALPIAEALVERAPDHFTAQSALAQALAAVCRLEEAQAHYREAIRLASAAGRPAYFVRALEEYLEGVEERMRQGACEPGRESGGAVGRRRATP